MLQFLRFAEPEVEESEYKVISGSDSFRFFMKRFGYVILLSYSTLFIASIEPFVKSVFEVWVFCSGGIITIYLLVRLLNQVYYYTRFQNGRITVRTDSIEIFNREGSNKALAEEVLYLKVNLFGNLIIQKKNNNKVSFPLVLLKEEDCEKIIAIFQDISSRRTEFYRKTWDFLEALLVAFILAMHIREFIVQAYYIPTGSMEDTLLVGDHLLVEKITFGPIIPKMMGMANNIHLDFIGLRSIKKGDIVIFRPPNEEEKDFIKRCIATPGDDLQLKDGYVYVNGKKNEESYIKGITSYRGFSEKKIEGKVPDGMVVVMGDNRENSYDSRGFGYLPIERIKGRAFILYWNTDQVKNFDFSRYGLIR